MQPLSLSAITCPAGPPLGWESSPVGDLVVINPYWQSA